MPFPHPSTSLATQEQLKAFVIYLTLEEILLDSYRHIQDIPFKNLVQITKVSGLRLTTHHIQIHLANRLPFILESIYGRMAIPS
jgi:hypothetical protein